MGEDGNEHGFNLETAFWKPRKAYYYSKHVLQETASERVGMTGCPQRKPVSYALPVGVVIWKQYLLSSQSTAITEQLSRS